MYTRLANLTAGNRPVYQRVDSYVDYVDYLFYYTRRWIIGSNYTVDAGGIRSAATAAACIIAWFGWGRWRVAGRAGLAALLTVSFTAWWALPFCWPPLW